MTLHIPYLILSIARYAIRLLLISFLKQRLYWPLSDWWQTFYNELKTNSRIQSYFLLTLSQSKISRHIKHFWKYTETRMYSSRMRTDCPLTISRSIRRGVSALCRPPWMHTPPRCPLLYTDPLPIGCKPPTLDADPPWMQIPLGMWPVMHAGKPPPPQWTEGMTHACENITFATTVAGGKKPKLL